jgi:hypothetical protein
VSRGDGLTGRFVCTHLEAYDKNVPRRNTQFQNILSSLLFTSSDPLSTPYQITDTSHLFVIGDLNYRLARLPHLVTGEPRENPGDAGVTNRVEIVELEKERADMLELDTLRREQKEGRVFGGLREGKLEGFAPTYKRVVGQVEGYSKSAGRRRNLRAEADLVGNGYQAGQTGSSSRHIPTHPLPRQPPRF